MLNYCLILFMTHYSYVWIPFLRFLRSRKIEACKPGSRPYTALKKTFYRYRFSRAQERFRAQNLDRHDRPLRVGDIVLRKQVLQHLAS